MSAQATECCPRFDPEPWEDKEIVWDNKRFLQDHVVSLFHMPLNFGAVMKRDMEVIEAAGAESEEMFVLSDENSLWGADVYLPISKEIKGVKTATLSGTFLSRVFEGPYRNMKHWVADMTAFARKQGREIQKLYFFYTTCPKCSKKYGENYVVILAQI
ncbi:hydrolase [Hahella sp. CCB-MM4]|uniref:hydrolase n=1 Tax=Hahella sp. (strain CCB-MM4) TaxID=1926491 RepID=UPI001FEFFB04|nr:hydrolase [Hahella sp. CCB-MM4]